MINSERRSDLIDRALRYNQLLREETKPMTNEERVFFLDVLEKSVKAASDIFKSGEPESC